MDPLLPQPGPRASGDTIQGSRPEQQDAFRVVWLAEERALLLVVADGLGGHAAGEIASRLAADEVVSSFSAARSRGMPLREAFYLALDTANGAIAAHQRSAPETAGMGTTLVAAHLSGDGLAWVSVGDSPLWLFHDRAVHRLNEDHSMRSAGPGAANANVVLSALDGRQTVLIDCKPQPLPIHPGDLVIIASDGLMTLSEGEIARIVGRDAAADAETIVRALLGAVEDCAEPYQDNCTVIVAFAP